jgi:DNA-directed RNA polymerase specialized sigma24 family protein
MISDGIENCINYFDNFDPSKSDNPFAYFTQIIYYAFLRRIQKEKKQVYTKHKIAENNIVFEEAVELNEYDDMTVDFSVLDAENISEFMKSFEESMEKKKQKRKKGIDMFIEEEIDEDSIAR